MSDLTTQDDSVEGVERAPNPRDAAIAQIGQAVHDRTAPDLAHFNEDTGETTPMVPAEVKPVEEPAPVAEPVVQEPIKMEALVVDGQRIEVPIDKVLEAGRRTLQKESAADARLREASLLLQQARQAAKQNQPVQGDPEPSPDAQGQQATKGLDPAMLEETVARITERKLYESSAQTAAARFKAEFPDIAADPNLMKLAASREDERLATVSALGEPLGDPWEAYRKHGEEIRKWKGGFTPVTADKTERKRDLTVVQGASARAPAKTEEKPLTLAQEIEQMRQQRSQGRQLQARS